MGVALTPTTTGGTAPEVEDGVYDMRFDGVESEAHPEWAGPNKWGKHDDGNRFRWNFTLLDGEGAVLYDEGEPITLNKLTNTSLNVVSKTTPVAVKVLKALLTPAEFAAFEQGTAPDSDKLIGRIVQGVVSTNDKGWPNIDDVMPASKATKARAAAAAKA